MMMRITATTSSEQSGNCSRGCHGTATNPRIETSTKRLPRRVRGALFGELTRWECINARALVVDSGPSRLRQVLQVGVSSIPTAAALHREKVMFLYPHSLPPLPSSTSRLSLCLPQVLGSSYSLHQNRWPLIHPNLHIMSRRIVSASGRPDASSVFLHRRCPEARALYPDCARGVRAWAWVEGCKGHHVGRSDSGQSHGRGGLGMGGWSPMGGKRTY